MCVLQLQDHLLLCQCVGYPFQIYYQSITFKLFNQVPSLFIDLSLLFIPLSFIIIINLTLLYFKHTSYFQFYFFFTIILSTQSIYLLFLIYLSFQLSILTNYSIRLIGFHHSTIILLIYNTLFTHLTYFISIICHKTLRVASDKSMENNVKSDPIQNTLRLSQLWDQKYSKRSENDNVFSGNVQQYQFKLIEQSEFILLRNKSRMERRVENLQRPNNTSHQSKSQPQKKVFVAFQSNRFHFQLIYPEQVVFFLNNLMDFEEEEKAKKIVFGKQQISSNRSCQDEIHCVIINKAPICPSHCLFVPWINGKSMQVGQQVQKQQLCQKIIPEAIPLVFTLLNMYEDLCIGYNSVEGSASVNNLHFHMFFKDHWIGKHKIPIQLSLYHEQTQKVPIDTDQDMQIFAFDTRLIQGFQLIISSEPGPKHFERINQIFQKLIMQNIPHNMMIMRKGQNIEVVIFVRNFETQKTKFACMQYAGVFCLDYEGTTKEIIQQKLKQMRIQSVKFKELIEYFKDQVQSLKDKQVVSL